MSVRSRNSREAVTDGVSGAGARPPPPDEVMQAWKGGGTIESIPAWNRLLRVLVVDDNRDAADSLSILVRIWGHDVRVAYDLAAALALADAERPDVLLLDIAMRKVDGFHLARHLRRQTRFQDALLVAVTGYGDEAHRRLWEGAFDHFLIKPVEPTTVEQLLLLERDRLARSPAEVGGANGNGWGGASARRCARPWPAAPAARNDAALSNR